MRHVSAAAIVALLASAALGQFVASNPGPINSSGAVGAPENGFFTYDYAGADFAVLRITFEGDVTAVNPDTFQSDLRWHVGTPSGATFDLGPFSNVEQWTGTAHIGPLIFNVPITGTSVGTWRFEAWESFDDAGVDARWTNVSFTFTAVSAWHATNYTSEATFLQNLDPNFYLEDFSTYTAGDPLNGSQLDNPFGPTNGFSYDAHAGQGLWSNVGALSVNVAFDPLLITFTGDPVTAVGGNFTATDLGGTNIPGDVTITLADNSRFVISNQLPTDFFGFSTAEPITSVEFNAAVGGGIARFVQIDHFYVGQVLAPQGCRGDMNCDGLIDFADINTFVAILTGATPCNAYNADVNGDGSINFADINPFVTLLAGGGHCP